MAQDGLLLAEMTFKFHSRQSIYDFLAVFYGNMSLEIWQDTVIDAALQISKFYCLMCLTYTLSMTHWLNKLSKLE